MQQPPRIDAFTPPDRTLMGPGPTDVHPDVLRSMAAPMLGHLDPAFLEVMDEVQALLRYTFRTDNQLTIPVSGTGSAAMESAIGNLVEPGDTMMVPANGYFGDRMGQMAERAGGEVISIDAPWGEPLDPADIEAAIERYAPDIVGIVHGETSTGVCQTDIETLTGIAHEHDALVIVDTVATLGGVEFEVDDWSVDAVYSGSQKCLSAPPGASPLTLSTAALEKIHDRDEPVRSWYLDLSMLEDYWGAERTYHHTAPISNVYSLREALRRVADEGIEERWARHRAVSDAIVAGVEAMGLEMLVEDANRLPTLNAVCVPDGVDAGDVINRMLTRYDIEIAGGLGDLAGEIFRIGCMGYSARTANVLTVLRALGRSLEAEGASVEAGDGVAAAADALSIDGS